MAKLKKSKKPLPSQRSLRSTLKNINAHGKLALFMGAGISMGCGLPGWEELVLRVLNKVWQRDPEMVEVLILERQVLATRYAKQKAGVQFNRVIHECLYAGDIAISPCIKAIATSGIRQICNFNFDDLVEEAFLTIGVEPAVATPIENCQPKHNGITVFHPHGMLPRFDRDLELDNSRIVFSEDDYHNLYSDPYSWANIVQLSLLTGFSVLFIGLSMQDPNLRRLIDLSRSKGFRNQHFAIFCDPTKHAPVSERSQQSRIRQMIEFDLKSLGVTPWFINDYEQVTDILKSIAVPYEATSFI